MLDGAHLRPAVSGEPGHALQHQLRIGHSLFDAKKSGNRQPRVLHGVIGVGHVQKTNDAVIAQSSRDEGTIDWARLQLGQRCMGHPAHACMILPEHALTEA